MSLVPFIVARHSISRAPPLRIPRPVALVGSGDDAAVQPSGDRGPDACPWVRSGSCDRTSRFARGLIHNWLAGSRSICGALRGMPQVPEKRGEWTVLDSTVHYCNPWITVRE